MSMIIQSRSNALSQNVKNILNYLDKQYQGCWDEVELDLTTGITTLDRELCNIYKALIVLKEHSKDQKQAAAINNYLKMLIKEGKTYRQN